MPDGATMTSFKWQIAENLSTKEIVHPLEMIVTKVDHMVIEFLYETDTSVSELAGQLLVAYHVDAVALSEEASKIIRQYKLECEANQDESEQIVFHKDLT